MNKKGFTLVELLAVIAILAILVIIALPNVMGMFNSAKKESFTTELKEIYKIAEQTWMSESMFNTNETVYSRCKTCSGKSLDLSGRTELEYYIKVNKSGKVVEFYATDGTYQYTHNGEMQITNIKNIKNVSDLDEDEKINISDSGYSNVSDSKYICKRATYLHKESCENGAYYDDVPGNNRNTNCKGDGYVEQGSMHTTIITYGSLGTNGVLTSGDAFDCDVNGDGRFDENSERFYYVSPKDGDTSSTYAALIYYNNTPDSVTTTIFSNTLYKGPDVAYTMLPSTTTWSNVSLANTTRQIKTDSNLNYVDYDGSTFYLEQFDYTNKAARFLTKNELIYACGGIGTNNYGYLKKCNYLIENTEYADAHKKSYWLETYVSSVYYVYYIRSGLRKLASNIAYSERSVGVRPVIEVPLDKIKY